MTYLILIDLGFTAVDVRYRKPRETIFLDNFFFKQKTAYEMLRSLVGSEMCIRDRSRKPLGRKVEKMLV